MRGHNCFCQKSLSVCPIAAASTTVTYLEIAEHTFQMLICSITMGKPLQKTPFPMVMDIQREADQSQGLLDVNWLL